MGKVKKKNRVDKFTLWLNSLSAQDLLTFLDINLEGDMMDMICKEMSANEMLDCFSPTEHRECLEAIRQAYYRNNN